MPRKSREFYYDPNDPPKRLVVYAPRSLVASVKKQIKPHRYTFTMIFEYFLGTVATKGVDSKVESFRRIPTTPKKKKRTKK